MYCLRCGRKVADGVSFCEECVKTAGQPLQPSPYLSERILLPNRTTPARRLEPRERKSERPVSRRPRKLIAAVVLLSVLCTGLAALCGYGGLWYYEWEQNNRRSPVQAENLRLNDEIKTYASQVESLNERIEALEALEDEVAELPTLQEMSEFINAHVVFVENDGTNYYHTYDCTQFKKQSYWAYSTNLAESQGYSPCPKCH